MKAQSNRRIVLHFNIDKTIVCRDPYNGLDSIPLTLADCVAKMVWGQVTVEDDNRKWTLAYDQFSHEQPEENLMTYSDFLDLEYPYKTEAEEEEDLEDYNHRMREIRVEKLLSFAKPGNPGSKFKSQVEKLNRATYLPKNVREDLGLNDQPKPNKDKKAKVEKPKEGEGEDAGEGEDQEEEEDEEEPEEVEETDEQKMINLFENQKYHLLPSFFKTLIYLKKAKREFAVVIRGEDEFIKPAVFEFNKFCVGEHPCFCGRSGTPTIKFDGSKNTKYCVIEDKCKANFYRFEDSYKMVFGTLDTEYSEDINKPEDVEEVFYDDIENGTRVLANDSVECYVELMELFKKYSGAAIREDKDQKRILYIDPADYDTQHIFFDAKSGLGDNCRISVRDIITDQEISFKDAINKYIAVVEPHRAVSEPDYFMKLIEMCEYTRNQEIELRESGQLDAAKQGKPEADMILSQQQSVDSASQQKDEPLNEWEKLQSLPNDQYLVQTIMPVLYQGLKVVSVERPE